MNTYPSIGGAQGVGNVAKESVKSEIAEFLDICKGNLEYLGKSVGILGTRLQPVLRNEPSTNEKDPCPPRKNATTQCGERLLDLASHADTIRAQVDELTRLLEV